MAYREGMSREARALWGAEAFVATSAAALHAVAPLPPVPTGPRCPACRYRADAPGHYFACGARAC